MYEKRLADALEKASLSAVEVERLAKEVADSELAIEPFKLWKIEHKDEQEAYQSLLRQLDNEKKEMNENIGASRKQITAYDKQIEEIYAREENSEYDL